MFRVFAPFMLGTIGSILWILAFVKFTAQRSVFIILISLFIYILLFLTLVGIVPNKWLHAVPSRDQNAEIIVIFSFGYEMDDGMMIAGNANQYLWNWTVKNRPPQARLVFMQEGVWAATDDQAVKSLGIERERIHRHDPHVYVDTLNAAFCAIQKIQELDKKKILLVAHDLQLQRVVWDFERVGRVTCPDCIFVIPEIRDVPYPERSVHFQTRNEFIYKITELLISRPRDFLKPVPLDCIAPIN